MSELDSRTEALRRAFDEAFQQPPPDMVARREQLLAVRCAELHVLLPIGALAGLQRRPSLTAVPSRDPALVGLCSFRGQPLGAWSLALLLGAESAGTRGWIAFARRGAMGLVFDQVDGLVTPDKHERRFVVDVDVLAARAGARHPEAS